MRGDSIPGNLGKNESEIKFKETESNISREIDKDNTSIESKEKDLNAEKLDSRKPLFMKKEQINEIILLKINLLRIK